MLRTFFIIALYLLAALALEIEVLPQFLGLVPGWLGLLFDPPLMASAGILIGFLRGEVQGMIVALIAACLLGFSQLPGQLGPSITSFTAVAFLAGFLARRLRMHGFLSRCFFLGLLLFLERLIWSLIRGFYQYDLSFSVPWLATLLMAVLGAWIYRLMEPSLRRNLIDAE